MNCAEETVAWHGAASLLVEADVGSLMYRPALEAEPAVKDVEVHRVAQSRRCDSVGQLPLKVQLGHKVEMLERERGSKNGTHGVHLDGQAERPIGRAPEETPAQGRLTIRKFIAAIIIVPMTMIVACDREEKATVSHEEEAREIATPDTGPWPYHDRKDLKEIAWEQLLKECPKAGIIRDDMKRFLDPASDASKDVSYLRAIKEVEETPVYLNKWSGTCKEAVEQIVNHGFEGEANAEELTWPNRVGQPGG